MQLGSVKLSSKMTSLTRGPHPWILVTLAKGDVIAIKWDDIIKTACDGSTNNNRQDDIFTSLLLEEPMDIGIEPALSQAVMLTFVADVHLAVIVNESLIAFSCSPTSCCVVNIRQSFGYQPNGLPAFPSKSISVIDHRNPYSSQRQESHIYFHIPHVIVCPFPTTGKDYGCDVCQLSIELFTHLFGNEDALVRSMVVVYGCRCGLVFGCSLKKSSANQHLLCDLEQPVLSIYPLSLCSNSFVHDTLLIIGTYGKVVLFKSNPSSNVTVQELLFSDCIQSSLLIEHYGLLLSTLTSVQFICLKSDCCLNESTKLISVFSNSAIVSYSAHHLLCCVSDQNGSYTLLALNTNNSLMSINLSKHMTNHLNVPVSTNISDHLKSTVKSIEDTMRVIAELNENEKVIDYDLTTLNEMLHLFGKQRDELVHSFVIEPLTIGYEQIDAMKQKAFVNFRLLYNSISPLSKGCFLNIELKPGQLLRSILYSDYKEQQNSHVTCISLKGLCSGQSLNLKLPVSEITKSKVINVKVFLSYCPTIAFSSSSICIPEAKTALILLHSETLNLLHFIQPTNIHQIIPQELNHSVVIIKISCSTMQLLTKSEDQSLSSSLVALLATNNIQKQNILHHLSSQNCYKSHDAIGFQCLLLPEGYPVIFNLYKSSENEIILYNLTITTSSLVHAIELSDTISQTISSHKGEIMELQQQIKQLQMNLLSAEDVNCVAQSKNGHSSLEYFKNYFQKLIH
jgi:hypothetical protein